MARRTMDQSVHDRKPEPYDMRRFPVVALECESDDRSKP
jgi:hypothetical protein